jgi:hypothetical protein
MMCIGEGTPIHQSRFFFQTWWFGVPEIGELLGEKLRCYISDCGPHRCSVELWQCVSRNSRQFLKGRGANLGRDKRNFRANLLHQVEDLDRVADANVLGEEGWALHYFLEDQVVALDRVEDEYWRQRSRTQWTLKGDSCITYFHAIANGRKRKCSIPCLVTEVGEVDEPRALMEHVY